ncbi:phosphate transporter [Nematocida sp. AWRm77]|nr:phosphate transporter [Nematocida sp. AWRm77]
MFTDEKALSEENTQASSLKEQTDALHSEKALSSLISSAEGGVPVSAEKINLSKYRNKIVGTAVVLCLSVLVYAGGKLFFGHTFRSDKALLCAAISFGATLLWSSGILPLEVTSFVLLPVLVLSGVLSEHARGVRGVFYALRTIGYICVSNVSLLLVGSCLLSVYFQNSGGDRLVLPYLLGGRNRSGVLFKAMCLSLGLSSVMSNVTAPIIIVSVLQSSATPPSPAMVMGVALAANIGGMLLPISSPQSVLGSSRMHVGWGTWLCFSVPTVLACFVVVYALLLFLLPHSRLEELPLTPEIDLRMQNRKLSILSMSAGAVLCWALAAAVSAYSPHFCAVPIAVLACMPGASRVLNRRTLEILSIAISGTALGKGIESTQMLEDIISHIISYNKTHSILLAVALSSFLMVVVSCLVCHTLSAVILLPILQKIGAMLHQERLLLGISTLACSCGMALPTSGFPNILASSVRDRHKKRILSTKTFIFLGTLSTLLCWVVIVTLGLFVMVCVDP